MYPQPYFGSSELSLGMAGAATQAHPQQHPTHSATGSPMLCILQSFSNSTLWGWAAPLVHAAAPYFLWQSCVQVLQRFACSQLFLGCRSPPEHTVAPHYVRPFSRQHSPAGGYCSILLALHSLQAGEPLVCTVK